MIKMLDDAENMFQALYALYCESNNCDLCLISEDDEKFFVHSFVLAASVPKIRRLLLHPVREILLGTPVKVSGVFGRELKLIIQFAYLKKCDLSEDPQHALELFRAAIYLGIPELKPQCEEILISALDVITSVEFLKSNLGEQVLLHEMSYLHLLRHLTLRPCTEWSMLSAECIISLLRDERLHAPFEEHALNVALQWVEFNPTERCHLLPLLLRSLRLGYLSPQTFHKLKSHQLIQRNPNAELVLEMTHLTIISTLPGYIENLPLALCPRLPHAVFLSIAGWATKTKICNNVECYDHLAERWTKARTLNLPSRRVYFGLEHFGDYLYVFGGYVDNARKSCLRLCLRTFQWSSICAMSEERAFLSTGVLHGEIYAIGGRSSFRRHSSAERYNPALDQWAPLPNMSTKRSDAGAAVLNGRLYVVGGYDGASLLRSVEIFNPVFNKWNSGVPLSEVRAGHSCIGLCGLLYVIGGFDGNVRLNSVECFDPVSSRWINKAPMLNPRSNFGVVAMDHRIFVFGGYCTGYITDSCEVYDSIDDCWYLIPSLPTARSGLSCCMIDDLNLSQWLLGISVRDQGTFLRDPRSKRPPYHPFQQDTSQADTWLDRTVKDYVTSFSDS